MTTARLEPATPLSQVKHSTTEPLCSLLYALYPLTVETELKVTPLVHADYYKCTNLLSFNANIVHIKCTTSALMYCHLMQK